MHVHSDFLASLLSVSFSESDNSELRSKLAQCFVEDRNWNSLGRLIDLMFGRDTVGVEASHLDAREQFWLTKLIEFGKCVDWARQTIRADGRQTYRRLGSDLDWLADSDVEWDLIRTLLFLQRRLVMPTKTLALVTSARNEGINILEWIAYHLSVGVDSIFIYTNDNIDGSLELLTILANAGVVSLIDNQVDLAHQDDIQKKSFVHSVNCIPEIADHEWVAFIDLDEFIKFDRFTSARAFFSDPIVSEKLKNSAGIHLNWKWYGGDQAFDRSDMLLLERYHEARADSHGKTISRVTAVTGFDSAHFPRLIQGCRLVDGSLHIMSAHEESMQPTYQYGQINHYWNKTFIEFVAKNIRNRGFVRDYDLFWKWGNCHLGKEEILPRMVIDDVHTNLAKLRAIPGVMACEQRLEARFKELIAKENEKYDLRVFYESLANKYN